MTLTLAHAQSIIVAALLDGRARRAKPLAVIILDAGGHPIAFAREDGASFFRLDIAKAKAMGALGIGDDSDVLAERAKANPVFFASVSAAVGGRVAFSPGGIVIRHTNGVALGAIGISGDTGDCDAACARAGLIANGYMEAQA